MHQVELLAPAGSFEALKAAIHNGADAIYLGGSRFGARAFAQNFDEEELTQAVCYAHAYGVKIYVTMNTLIYDEEIEDVLAYVAFLQSIDVDALIIQDIGLLNLVHQRFPDLELHVSTQMHIHNEAGIQLLKDMGASRVVLPRETPIETIKKLSKCGVELEVFVQGALCVSYSGQCLMSSKTLSRSGNRGACAQSCRMRYTLEELSDGQYQKVPCKDAYLLSPKDMNTLPHIQAMMEAGISSFKIEGRMKRSEYVALMTRSYREAMDTIYAGQRYQYQKATQKAMEKVFSRGFTHGYAFQALHHDIMSMERPNHGGVEVGSVVGFSKDKIKIKLSDDLAQKDGIRFLDGKDETGFTLNRLYRNGLLVNQAYKGEIVEIDKSFYVDKNTKVVKTSDVHQLQQLATSYEQEIKKIPVQMSFTMQEVPTLKVNDGTFEVRVESSLPAEVALKVPLSAERIQQQLAKTKDTIFTVTSFEMLGVYDRVLPIKALNEMRRQALEQLYEVRTKRHLGRRDLKNRYEPFQIEQSNDLVLVVHTKAQFDALIKMGYDLIYIGDEKLYQQLQDDYHAGLRCDRVNSAYEYHYLPLIQEHAGLQVYERMIADPYCNVANAHSAAQYFKHGASIVGLSLEHDEASLKNLLQNFRQTYGCEGNFMKMIYGREELMLSEHCIIQTLKMKKPMRDCGLCRKKQFVLKDVKQNRYPILTDLSCRMHLLHSEVVNEISEIKKYQEMGISNFQIVFTMESANEVKHIMQQVKENL